MHPLVSAFASRRDLVAEHCASESIAWRAGLSLLIDYRDRWIDEVMASVSVPRFLVGFFASSGRRYFRVLIWDNTFFNSPIATQAHELRILGDYDS